LNKTGHTEENTLSTYEGLFIFPETLKDDALEKAIDQVKADVKRLSGAVESVTRVGRKPFARPIRKQGAGHYVVMNLEIAGENLKDLNARLNLNDDVVRVQFLKLPASAPVSTGAASLKSARPDAKSAVASAPESGDADGQEVTDAVS